MNTAEYSFEECIDFETQIGEGPVWDDENQALWFVDILAPALFRLDAISNQISRYDMPDLVTSVGMAANARLVLSLRKGVYMFDPTNGALTLLAEIEPDAPENRLNDGKVGPDGNFWIGSMHDIRPPQPTGRLYRVSPDGQIAEFADKLHVSNGLAWSPDHRTMYHADSRAPWIKAYDFDWRTGIPTRPRLLATPDENEGLPDGAAVDANGNYWSAGVTAGRINIYSPEGRVLDRIVLPMDHPTMPCFGGADLKTVYVTGLSREPVSAARRGRLISFRSDVPGTPAARFGKQANTIYQN